MSDRTQMEQGFNQVLGLRLDEVGAERVVVSFPITPVLLQPYGIVHGGVWSAVVETAASVGAATWWGDRGDVVGVSNHTNFIRAARDGDVRATATPVHRGRSTQLWQVEVRDDQDRLLARGEVRLQNLASSEQIGR